MNATEQSIERSRTSPVTAAERRPRRIYSPVVDALESEDAYVLTVDLPGVAEEDIDVTVERNVLTLSARRAARTHAEHRRVLGELVHGDYRRSFTLPEQIDRDRIAANLRNGVLTLSVPKAAAIRRRKIAVQAGA